MTTITHLDNGIQVVTHHGGAPGVTSLGLWIRNGSRHQQPGQDGYAHFLEHVLFKGADGRGAHELSLAFESMGGQVNAHTGRELTALHGVVPSEHCARLCGIFADMLTAPGFTDSDVELERDVIAQEMAMVRDTPDELAEEDAVARAWRGHPVGRPILGSPQVVAGADADGLRDYLDGLLCGSRLLVVAHGDTVHDELLGACHALESLDAGAPRPEAAPTFTDGDWTGTTDSAQTQLLWLMDAPAVNHPDHAALVVANYILGGGEASRLYQDLREQAGLVYDIHSRFERYSDCGLWLVATACDPGDEVRCRQRVETVISRLCENGPDATEMTLALGHLGAALALEQADPEACMEQVSMDLLYRGEVRGATQRLDALAAVRAADVQRVLRTAMARRASYRLGPGTRPAASASQA